MVKAACEHLKYSYDELRASFEENLAIDENHKQLIELSQKTQIKAQNYEITHDK